VTTVRGRICLALSILLAMAILLALPASRSLAANTQQAMLEDDIQLMDNPVGTLEQLRLLGVQRIRVAVRWSYIAPSPNSSRPPRNFNASDPASYPAANWGIWDEIVSEAQQEGIGLDFDVMGGAPLWALGQGAPRGNTNHNWEPSPSMYRAFVHALGIRYSGSYDPRLKRSVEDANDLPRVSFWSVWNEPDYGPSLAPQGVPGHLTIPDSPRMYRNLVAAAWSALQQTGHGRDTFIVGELAPRGYDFWGVYSGMKPVVFLQNLYCVDSAYRELRGAAAAVRGCPTTAAGSRRFRAQNPGLFKASAFSDHPYMRWYPPNTEEQPDPGYSSLAEIGNLERALDRLQRIYGSGTRYPIWDTEFGYITTPPKHDNQYEPSQPHHQPWPTQATAAYYINWAEYISWRNPRIASFSQYLLHDPLPALRSNDWGAFASGLLSYNHAPKATYAAWRLPLFLPVTTAHRGRRLEVWGCARPASYAALDTGEPQSVAIQFEPRSGGGFRTLQTVSIAHPGASCYFDVRVSFPSSGLVRLSWSYPTGDQLFGASSGKAVFSRQVQLTLH
jgi:hypothetical protein